MNPLFTILTASHNGSSYIEKWADSIVTQNYRPLEVVFVDDASTDETDAQMEEVAKRFKKRDISLVIVKNPKRLHYADSQKVAYENSSGQYFGVLDVDDMLISESVEFVMNLYLENPKVSYIYTQFEKWDKTMTKRKGKGFSKRPPNGLSLLDMGARNVHAFSHWRTFSDRIGDVSLIWKKGQKCSVDKYMGYKLEEMGVGAFTPRICYRYRFGTPGSISSTERSKAVWREVMKEASQRRKKGKIKARKIIQL
jgi:glycosyltransferase involved in cell wall biosynthesis